MATQTRASTKKGKSTRGGHRPGAGRQPAYSKRMRNVPIAIPPEWVDTLTRLGEGDLAAGVHIILERAPEIQVKSPRPFGLCAGEFTVPDDFDAPLD